MVESNVYVSLNYIFLVTLRFNYFAFEYRLLLLPSLYYIGLFISLWQPASLGLFLNERARYSHLVFLLGCALRIAKRS